jgi:pyruvate-formate lyase-activating enzyme
MKFRDQRIEDSVKDELGDLQAILDIVSQLSVPVALRVLEYCTHYVREGKDVHPSAIPTLNEVKEMLAQAVLNKSGASSAV